MKKGFTKEYLLAKLIELSNRLGHSPSQRDVDNLPGFPSRGAYRKHFGTFAKAMKKAGLPLIGLGSLSLNHPYNSKHPRFKARIENRRGLGISKNHLKIRFGILERDGFTCKYCGRTPENGAKLVIDHIVPFSKGGKTTLENLVTSCFECNMGKSDILIELHHLKKQSPIK